MIPSFLVAVLSLIVVLLIFLILLGVVPWIDTVVEKTAMTVGAIISGLGFGSLVWLGYSNPKLYRM